MTAPIKHKVILPPGSPPERGPGWTDLWVREGSSDEDVLTEVWIKDVYHLRGLTFVNHDNPDHSLNAPIFRPRIVDVGAHTGIFAALCLQMFPTCDVVALEPDGPNLDLLYLNTVNWRDRCTITRGAIGPTRGATNLLGGYANGYTDPTPGGGSQSVEMYPLAEFVDRPTALLKVDVEGAEYGAFMACPEANLAMVDRIHMEWHGTSEAPWMEGAPTRYGELLTKLGYTHTVQTFGRPDQGGYLFATRYGT